MEKFSSGSTTAPFTMQLVQFINCFSLKEVEDIDYQSITDRLGARWSGFSHPHLEVTYSVGIGTDEKMTNVRAFEPVNTTSYLFQGLNLQLYQVTNFEHTFKLATKNMLVLYKYKFVYCFEN